MDGALATPKERLRACVYCNKSKTKCIWRGEQGDASCLRCIRLSRTCIVGSKKAETRRRGPGTRVGQLEEKLDGILSLLNASHQLQHTPLSSESPSQPSPLSSAPDVYTGGSLDTNAGLSNTVVPMISTSVLDPDTSTPFDHADVVPGLCVSFTEAERLLDLYRTDYSPHFPFVPIHPSTGALELFHKHPFLFRTIIQIVAPQNAAVQRDVAQWFRAYIAEHVVVNLEKRLELLQAIVLFIAWGDVHFYVESPATTLLQLAVGLVTDLGLSKPPKIPGHVPSHVVDEARRIMGLRSRIPHSLEDMRAFLGCFYINSTAAILFRHVPMLPRYSYVTTCCDALEKAQEYDSDVLLVNVIRLQRILCRIRAAFTSSDMENGINTGFSASSAMAISSIRADMETLKRAAPIDIQTHWSFKVCYQGTLVRLYEPAIYMRASSLSGDYDSGARRSEALCCCLDAIKAFFESYAAIPLPELTYLPFPVYSHFTFSVVSATRLLFLSDSDWNRQLACRSLDFPTIIQSLSDRCEKADDWSVGEEWRRKRKFVDDARSVMAMHRDKLRWIGSWSAAKLGASSTDEPQIDHDARNPDRSEILFPIDVDDVWWQAVLEDHHYDETNDPAGLTR
ncbi:hypothetical protein B0T22DRAFT_148598 [Podospora appendiculata]|uniref:Zn(2)-C6 fungal-type domain-containing protein n=1 Tax=Podospora appendiculata TaxID=314037 RepID=A0AAE0X8W8_9PEZI|nr:hypothetical protein B0T22DRAFT_148598 [Podospora appendiculata]